MINLALKTEYSFKKCFGKVQDLVDACEEKYLGIADLDNTFGHIKFAKACKAKDITPIFGVRLRAHPTGEKCQTSQNYFIFIAKNSEGLRELYELVGKAYEQFHYFPRLTYSDINLISRNIYVMFPSLPTPMLPEEVKLHSRIDYKITNPYDDSLDDPSIAIQENFFPLEDDEGIYQILAGARKDGDSYIFNFEQRIPPMHILDEEWFHQQAVVNTLVVAKHCKAEIQQAEMVKFDGGRSITQLCVEGIEKKGLDFTDEYEARLTREIELIEDKGYEDYFLIVADMLRFANKHMLVGPARGSSAGSLVCYLLDITKVDPIKFGLIFERFIDINRFDLPDIDIDFPDSKRHMVVEYLHSKYGEDKVKNLANINRYQAKSAIDIFGIGLGIPKEDCDTVKNAMIERSAGDARNQMCMNDTFNNTEPGREFIEKYPSMIAAGRIEGHANHSSKHAAGVIVSNISLTNFGGVNVRDDVIMMDKKDAEAVGLLKIDCLGLKTLAILEDAAELIGKHKDFYYDLSLDDEETICIFKQGRLNGIFQFEGPALKMLCKTISVNCFNDITAITSLARPGALRSGGAAKFSKRRNGDETPTYFGDKHKSITEETYGIMVYQEQLMSLAKELAHFTWMEISDLRLAAAKSLGDSYFSKYSDKFVAGCMEHSGMTKEEGEAVWKDIQHAGSWLFNRSHAVSYAMISYFTAYLKAHHPREFLAASLNHATDDIIALRMLRDGVENNSIEYVAFDPDESMEGWSVREDGVLVGGLSNIKGVGPKKAIRILEARRGEKAWTPTMLKKMQNPETPFDILYPTQHLWGEFFDDPGSVGLMEEPTKIRDIYESGDYTVIGRLMNRNLNDLNEYNKVEKRGYELEDHTLYLNIILEDDHDSIMCSIDRYNFDRLDGRIIAEQARVEEDWFLVQGKMSGSWRGISVKNIINLTQWRKQNDKS